MGVAVLAVTDSNWRAHGLRAVGTDAGIVSEVVVDPAEAESANQVGRVPPLIVGPPLSARRANVGGFRVLGVRVELLEVLGTAEGAVDTVDGPCLDAKIRE